MGLSQTPIKHQPYGLKPTTTFVWLPLRCTHKEHNNDLQPRRKRIEEAIRNLRETEDGYAHALSQMQN